MDGPHDAGQREEAYRRPCAAASRKL